MYKPAQTSQPIHPLLASRWSTCAFDSCPLPPTALKAMMEAARWAPSCFGVQPWRFVFCDKERNPTAWEKALTCLSPGNQIWAKQAPALVLVCANTVFSNNRGNNAHHAYDSGAAAICLVLEAENQGLRAHQMGGFNADAARQAFSIPDDCVCLSFIAIGKQVPATDLEDTQLRAREEAPRKRLPLEDNFFDGVWGTPVK